MEGFGSMVNKNYPAIAEHENSDSDMDDDGLIIKMSDEHPDY